MFQGEESAVLKERWQWTYPIVFSPVNPRAMYASSQHVWKTIDGGETWRRISPDLTRHDPKTMGPSGGPITRDMNMPEVYGVVFALAPSKRTERVLWAGSDDGLVHVTRDGGKAWTNVTPPALRAWDKVSQIDAGHADAAVAYVSVNAIRRDDMRPHVYRTHDSGATWTEIVTGLSASGPVNVVREDPKQPGLLFAGTERQVYFSIDDGEHWQPLRQNMPASSVRDLVVHEDDLVVGTHGRSIWILDGISALRELAQAVRATRPFLFTPPQATRVRWNMFSDTPLPPEEPTGQNPPDGAILDYYLPAAAAEVVLDVIDERGVSVRRYSSRDEPEPIRIAEP